MVLEAGGRALEKWEARGMRRDILLACALAHLGLASDALEARDQVREGTPPLPGQHKCTLASDALGARDQVREGRPPCQVSMNVRWPATRWGRATR